MAIIFLQNNIEFNPAEIETHEQPLLPDATKMQAKYFENAIKLLETCQEQRDMLSNKEIKDAFKISENNQINKDVLLHKGKSHKGITNLIKRKNPCTGLKHEKSEHKSSFKRLESFGLRTLEEKRLQIARNTFFSQKNLR